MATPMSLTALIAETGRAFQRLALEPWPVWGVGTAGLVGVQYAGLGAGLGAGLAGLVSLLVASAMMGYALAQVEAQVGGYMGGGGAAALASARTGVAALLVTLVLGFFLLLSVMAGGLVVFGVMVGNGFDFDTASEGPDVFNAAFDAFLETPAGQISQGVFWLSLAVWLVGFARAVPFAAGTVKEGRVVVLQAFNWSRGNGIRILAALGLALVPAGVLFVVASGVGGGFGAGLAALGTGFAALGTAATSLAVYDLTAGRFSGEGGAR